MSYRQHVSGVSDKPAQCAVITLSDTRTAANDTSGQTIQKLLAEHGHHVVEYKIIPDDPAELQPLVESLLGQPALDVILTNGGTGISPRDRTMQVINNLLDMPLPGFGELFRMLSWQEIGSGAMLSRAEGGVARGKLLFAMPGSTSAVDLAMTRLILPELQHLLNQLRKKPASKS